MMTPRLEKLRMTNEDTLSIGRIVGAFGVRGELKCDPTSAGRTVISAGARVRCARDGDVSVIHIRAVREHKGRLLIFLEGVEDAGSAERYIGCVLQAPRAEIALADGEYLDVDLIGCDVSGVDGASYGTVQRVEHFPASDMLVVGGRMVPMVAAIVKSIELPARRIVIDPPPGLLD